MADDHDRFLAKNKMLAQGYEISATQEKVKKSLGDSDASTRPSSCFNCQKKFKCIEFKNKATSGSSGVVSIGAETTFLCEHYQPIPVRKKERSLSSQQIKNIVKAAKKGRL